MRTCASGDIFRNQICQMCCLLYFWEYTEIPHLDKVPNFPSLDSLWFISSRKSCRSFPPKFAPFWLASMCRANVENVATMFLRQTRRQGPMPCPPPFNMWKEAAFQRNKKHNAAFIVACMLQLSPFAWLWNVLGIPSESRLDSQPLAGAWIHRTSWEEKLMKPKRCIG